MPAREVSNLLIRPYRTEDRARVLEIFRSNCPRYFRCSDEADLTEFLENYADENFLLAELQGDTIGCGGHYVRHDQKKIGIAWVMFRRNALGARAFREITDELFSAIMERIRGEGVNYPITIHTTQLMERLFRSYGFAAIERTPDGFGGGLDHVVMVRNTA